MTTLDLVLDAFQLPASTRVDQRVPKTLLTEHGAPTAADKRAIEESVEETRWLAVLKPATVAIAAFEDHERDVPEVAVVRLRLRQSRQSTRLVELVHRAIPYPVALLTEVEGEQELSFATKRRSLSEVDAVTLDGDPMSVDLDPDAGHFAAFTQALALTHRPYRTLHALYLGWLDAVVAYHAASRTGRFELSDSRERALTRHTALLECERLEREIARVTAEAKREKQMARRAGLNLELAGLRRDLEAAREAL